MTIFFTADTHFNHGNIIKYCKRPFSTIAEHNDTIIKNWNSLVKEEDTVYHLGDFCFGGPKYVEFIRNRLNGKIHLIRGNHDKFLKPSSSTFPGFESIKDMHTLKTQLKNEKIEIVLCHYPLRSWDKSFHGSWHLFGHVHGHLPPHGLSFDVGVDSNHFSPISLEQVSERINSLKKDIILI